MAGQPPLSLQPAMSGTAIVNNEKLPTVPTDAWETSLFPDSISKDTLKARRADADAKERRRRFHDRHMLLDTINQDKVWVSTNNIGQRAITTDRVQQMFKMFGAKMWPKSEAAWARYDRDRDQAVKEIMDARRLRGFGLFDLENYLARTEGDKQAPIKGASPKPDSRSKKSRNNKLDSESRAIEPLRFDDTFTRALEEIEEGPLTFDASFKRALESDNDDYDESNETKRPKQDMRSMKPIISPRAYAELFTRCSRGQQLLANLAKLISRKEDGRNQAMSFDREKEVRTTLNYCRMNTILKAGEVDIAREVQLQEAAILEIEVAIDRLKELKSRKRAVTRSQRRRQAASERDEASQRNAMIDSWRPRPRVRKRDSRHTANLALHERKTKEPEHQVSTVDRNPVPVDEAVGVNGMVESYEDAHVMEL